MKRALEWYKKVSSDASERKNAESFKKQVFTHAHQNSYERCKNSLHYKV